MNKKLTVIIILILCFFIGFSIPYIYENYGTLIRDYVNGDNTTQVNENNEVDDVNTENKSKEKQTTVDYNVLINEAEDNFYAGNYKNSLDKYIELYEKSDSLMSWRWFYGEI